MDTENNNSNNNTNGFKADYFLPLSILISGILISGSIVYVMNGPSTPGKWGAANITGQGQPSEGADKGQGAAPAQAPQAKSVALNANDVILGDAKAPVTIIEYGDYQCPFCVRFFNQVEPTLRDKYVKTGKAKIAFRGFQFLGPESTLAGEAAECAKEQNKFWVYHDALYKAEEVDGQENNGNLTQEFLVKTAGDLGLNSGQFSSCLGAHKYAKAVEQLKTDAGTVGVNSTPITFINGEKITGAQPIATFEQAIANALKGN